LTESLLGKTVSHYRITRALGAGGMGVVYEAEDTRLGRHVAVKFLSKELERDPSILERFQREARAASALNHPGICTVHAIDQHEGQHFIVLELLEGQTLAERIGRRPLEIGELLDFGIQIADALEAAHAKGIVHRDLKPVNLMVNARGQVKILDFGLAKMTLSPSALDPESSFSQVETLLEPGELTVAGTVLGTVYYMSPEQARGLPTDARTDLFSLGALLYQMAAGELPFQGDTQAVVFEAILNRDPRPVGEANPKMPPGLGPILEKSLEKDRDLRYQTATELRADLVRLKRNLGSGRSESTQIGDSKGAVEKQAHRSVAVLYFENLGGAKEEEYFRDGITEDMITELSKIRGLDTYPRTTMHAFRDRSVSAVEVGRQLQAGFVLEGSLRRAGNRLRINAQLVDTATGFPIWSERFDREMADVFEVQDEIAREIARALRVTLTPQEQQEIAAKPTENLQAYDLYLRGRSYARRQVRQDMEFALQLYEHAIGQDAGFALAYAGTANVCAVYHYVYDQQPSWLTRARAAAEKASALEPNLPEAKIAKAWILYAEGEYDETLRIVRSAIAQNRDTDSAYYLLLRTLFATGRHREIAEIAEAAVEASGTDYNVFVPITNALGVLGERGMVKRFRERMNRTLQEHLRQAPEDARARILLAGNYAYEGRVDEAVHEASFAMVLQPNDAMMHYNAACTFSVLGRKSEALDALGKAWRAGFRDADWVRRDPDLEILHGEPEFEKLYPEKSPGS
jgi:non-specific serine/threonine protein kinase